MRIRWTLSAQRDVERIYEFVAFHDQEVALRVVNQLVEAPNALRSFRRRGSLLSEYAPREIREFRVGNYLLRYELSGSDVFVLRFFHVRENRFG